MEDHTKIIEPLITRITDYSKTTYQLIILKTLDKTSDIGSSFIAHTIVLVLMLTFIIFLNLGLAFWLGIILGEMYFGFFAVAAFYGIAGLFFRLFMHKWLKGRIRNSIIRFMLK
jgi:hypothetical protein